MIDGSPKKKGEKTTSLSGEKVMLQDTQHYTTMSVQKDMQTVDKGSEQEEKLARNNGRIYEALSSVQFLLVASCPAQDHSPVPQNSM
jgi:hypothetical protein